MNKTKFLKIILLFVLLQVVILSVFYFFNTDEIKDDIVLKQNDNSQVLVVDKIDKGVSKLEENSDKKKDIIGKNDFEIKKFDKDIKTLSFTQLNNSLYSNGGADNLKEKIKILSEAGMSSENRKKAVFLESFLGEYKDALVNRAKICKDNNFDYCKKINLNLISYRPEDTYGNILDNVEISIDGKDYGILNGKNNFKLENNFIHRIKISKQGYLDFYKKISIDSKGDLKESINPKLIKADSGKVIDNNLKNNIKTSNFSYNIEENTFRKKDGTNYKGKVKIYLFDITEDDGDLNVLNLDTFDNDGTYIGGSMVTYGMPLIKVYDVRGNQLTISKDIIGRGKIQNIEKAPGIDLENVPKNIWLSRDELLKYKIPPFWRLNSDSGVWVESEMKILDTEGNYEFKLY